MMVAVEVPIRLESNANGSQGITRGGRIGRSKKRQSQKRIVALVLQPKLPRGLVGPSRRIRVTLTRIAPRALDDDNLAYAFKGVRDSIAKCLGVDDRDPRVSWDYAQSRRAPKEYAIAIVIIDRAEAA